MMNFKKKNFLQLQLSTSTAEKPLTSAFTLLEVVLAMMLLGLLAGAIYSLSTASISVARETVEEQLMVRRLEGFLTITRNAFLNLPAHGKVILNSENSSTSIPDLNFENAAGIFGLPSLAGGTLVLSARPRSDGTRTFSILRLPKDVQGADRDRYYEGDHWIPLLPKVQKPHWSFFRNGDWLDEWPSGAGRPQLVRLQMEVAGMKNLVESIFYIPPVGKIILQSDDDSLLNSQGGGGENHSTANPSATPSQQKTF